MIVDGEQLASDQKKWPSTNNIA